MQTSSPPAPEAYEWQPCFLLFPRVGKLMDRHGLRTRLILPGGYYARRSRTFGTWIYRKAHAQNPPRLDGKRVA